MLRSTTRERERRERFVRLVLIGLVSVLATGVLPLVAGADRSWRDYHWETDDRPFTLQVGDNASGYYDAALRRVARDWGRSRVINVKLEGGGTNPNSCRFSTGRVEICSAAYGRTGWIGHTDLDIDNGHITRARILLNDTYFREEPFNNEMAKRHVICQEMGHALGLGDYNRPSCMDETNWRLTNAYATPSRHDYDQLARKYDHTHGRTASTTSLTDPSATDATAGGEQVTHEVPTSIDAP